MAFTQWADADMLQNAPIIAAAGMIYAPMGEGCVSFVDARDIAAAATRALLDDGTRGRPTP